MIENFYTKKLKLIFLNIYLIWALVIIRACMLYQFCKNSTH
jgi:hypothetical protein